MILVAQRGHVGRTTGKTGTAGEQLMAMGVSKELAENPRPGWTVRLIDADEPTSAYEGNAFVAIHGDGSTNPSVGGASVGYRLGGKELAAAWKKAYDDVWPFAWKADNYTRDLAGYYGTGRAVAAGNPHAIVIEVGMMTNLRERAWIDSNHPAIAASIWDAVAGKAVTMIDYRIVMAEARTAEARDATVKMARDLGNAVNWLGRSFWFHAPLDEVKQLERFIDTHPDIKRGHGVAVAAGTHGPVNQSPPQGRWADAEAFGAGVSSALRTALEDVRAALQSALGIVIELLRSIGGTT